MDEKQVIEILEGISKKLDILIEMQNATIRMMDEWHDDSLSLEQRKEEWMASL